MSRNPSYQELKQSILYRNPAFQPHTVVPLDSSNRITTSPLNNPTWVLPVPVKGAYAVSLKSLTVPATWPNVATTKQFEVTYGSVVAFPANFELTPGVYT